MSIRLPKASTNFKGYTNSQLLYAAQNIHNKILLAIADFATPPVTMVQFQTDINAFRTTSVSAIKGSKADTAAKNAARLVVKRDLQQLAYYVTQIAQATYTVNKDITAVQNLILESGFKISKGPAISNATTGIQTPIVRKAISKALGTLNFIIRNYTKGKRGKKTYQINYRTSEIPAVPPVTTPTPAGNWETFTVSGSNKITITGLIPGVKYDYAIAAIGGIDIKTNAQNPINYTDIKSIVITAGNNILA